MNRVAGTDRSAATGRHSALGIEIEPRYAGLARRRLAADAPLLDVAAMPQTPTPAEHPLPFPAAPA